MSPIQCTLVCVLSLSLVSGQESWNPFPCNDALCTLCSRTRNAFNWCTMCTCDTNRELDPCRNTNCDRGFECKVVQTRGWFPRSAPRCVEAEKTTTPPTTTTDASAFIRDGQCRSRSDCNANEICQKSDDQEFGTCRFVTQRSINPNCLEDMNPGSCRAAFPKYFYNKTSSECQMFFWGGCERIKNSFDTMEKCNEECVNVLTRDDDPCTLPKDTGICRAILTNFFFNSKTGKCEEFKYGGCGGNANRFLTVADCESKCAKGA